MEHMEWTTSSSPFHNRIRKLTQINYQRKERKYGAGFQNNFEKTPRTSIRAPAIENETTIICLVQNIQEI